MQSLHFVRSVFMALACGSLMSLFAVPYNPPANNRQKAVFNQNWKFSKSNPSGAEGTGFNDGSWATTNLPHCFNIPWWVDQHIDFGGIGWYRKHFALGSEYASKKISIEFEGVFLHCWVYFNGTQVAEHKGGFTSFIVDISGQAKTDGTDNVLAVKVSSEWEATIAPRAGDFIFIGGIYRDVYLVITDPLHVAYYGTSVTTPFGGNFISSGNYNLPTSYAQAPVKVVTEVQNQSAASSQYVLRTYIVDKQNQIVDSMISASWTVQANATDAVTQTVNLSNPHFWSPSDPYLYRVYSQIQSGSGIVDYFESPLGVRWLQFTGGQGFWINGQQLYLHGFDVHQDHAGWATAVTNAGQYRDVKLCKDAGARFIRGSHYPKDPAFVKACDELGVCLMLEMCYWGKGGGSGADASPPSGSADFVAFQQNCEAQMKEMIRTFRNNPSVIIWSAANEPTGGALDCGVINAVAKSADPSRATCRVDNFSFGSGEDISGHNGDPVNCGSTPTLLTELWESAEINRPGAYSGQPDDENPCRIGTARWAAFDYGTHENWTLNMVGMCDNYRIPKRRYYWCRNRWLGTAAPTWPVAGTAASIKLTTDKSTIINDGTDDCQILATVCNLNYASLVHNNLCNNSYL